MEKTFLLEAIYVVDAVVFVVACLTIGFIAYYNKYVLKSNSLSERASPVTIFWVILFGFISTNTIFNTLEYLDYITNPFWKIALIVNKTALSALAITLAYKLYAVVFRRKG